MDELTQKLSDLIPKSLDDIIRKNRELVELRMVTEVETDALRKEIPNPYPVKDVIEDWRLIGLCEKRTNWAQVMLLGASTFNNCAWLTSTIVAIDFAENIVLTKSGSIYRLGQPGKGEPPTGHLIHVCATLHMWGSGTFLGTPEFFY